MFRTASTLKEGRDKMDDIVESYRDIGVRYHPARHLLTSCRSGHVPTHRQRAHFAPVQAHAKAPRRCFDP